MKETYLVFIINCYQMQTEQGQLIDNVTMELVDTSYENALKRAEQIIKKDHYRLSGVIEKFIEKK